MDIAIVNVAHVDYSVVDSDANIGDTMIWFKGDKGTDVFVFNPLTGTKRHITSAEGRLLKLTPGYTVLIVAQATADLIPVG